MPGYLRPFVPFLFVLLWSSGFILARYGTQTAEPATLLALRFFLAGLILAGVAVAFPQLKKSTLTGNQIVHAAIAGILLQAIYLGGVFAGVSLGIGAILSSLIVSIQPILTVLLASVWLLEPVTSRKLLAVVLGFVGVCLVISEWGVSQTSLSPAGIGFCVSGLFGITLGTLYQKRFCQNMDLHINMAIQYFASALFLLPFAAYVETFSLTWSGQLVLVLIWLIFVLSIAAVFLLMWLIKEGEASKVSTLFFLVPPVVAIEAWILFDEPLTWRVITGMSLAVLGVAVVNGLLQRKERF